jgi:bacteriorhodopsin
MGMGTILPQHGMEHGQMGRETVIVLWCIAAAMTIGLISFIILTILTRGKLQFFASTFVIITFIAALSYVATASGFGTIGEAAHVVFLARSIGWAFITPLLLFDLALIALPKVYWRTPLIIFLLSAGVLMIITGSISALIRSNDRWGWFGSGVAAFVIIVYMMVQFMREAKQRGPQIARHFRVLSTCLIGLWVCYPILWASGTDGLGLINLNIETVLFGILDVFATVGFGIILLSYPKALELTEIPDFTFFGY